MKVVELMRPDVKTIGVKDMLVDAMVALRDAGISALPVLDENWKPIAVVTNQDVIAASLKCRNTLAGAVQTRSRFRRSCPLGPPSWIRTRWWRMPHG